MRAAGTRETVPDAIAKCFRREQISMPDCSTIPDMLKSIDKLPYPKQQYVWNKVGTLTAALRQHSRNELAESDRIPNYWMNFMRSQQIKSLAAAAEKYHRKHLRRQMRSMPARPTIQISDDSSSDVEIIAERPPLHPDPTQCNAFYRTISMQSPILCVPCLT